MSFRADIDAFVADLRARHYSPRSVALYAGDLARLAAHAGERPPEALQAHDLRRCLAQLNARGYAPRSLARMLSAWRSFYTWLGRQGRVHANPCSGLRPPKGSKRLPHTLTPDTLARMLDAAPGDGPMARRDRAMFELMYSSGLRLAELVGLDCADVALDTGEVRVTGKGRKTRIVPVGRQALDALRDWLTVRATLAGDTPALFVGARGARISPRVVQARLERLALTCGIRERVHPHALRDAFASHLLQSSGDLRRRQAGMAQHLLHRAQVAGGL
jgi:integrase/recombinase XerC